MLYKKSTVLLNSKYDNFIRILKTRNIEKFGRIHVLQKSNFLRFFRQEIKYSCEMMDFGRFAGERERESHSLRWVKLSVLVHWCSKLIPHKAVTCPKIPDKKIWRLNLYFHLRLLVCLYCGRVARWVSTPRHETQVCGGKGGGWWKCWWGRLVLLVGWGLLAECQ